MPDISDSMANKEKTETNEELKSASEKANGLFNANDIIVKGSNVTIRNIARQNANIKVFDLKGCRMPVSTHLSGHDLTFELAGTPASAYIVSITVNGYNFSRNVAIKR
jgi:hypothetical protein